MKILKVNDLDEVPAKFTGVTEISKGTKIWFRNRKIHRLDGPAIEWKSGSKTYSILGQTLSKKEFESFRFLWEQTFRKRTPKLMRIFVKLAKAKP